MNLTVEATFSNDDIRAAVAEAASKVMPALPGYHVEVDTVYIGTVRARLVKDETVEMCEAQPQ
jgi:hypothetical protein